jgi:hypothetical protein
VNPGLIHEGGDIGGTASSPVLWSFKIQLNAVENKQDYLARLKLAVEHLHKCGAVHSETVPVHEVFREETVWEGDIEVFDLTGHPKAKRAYAWSHPTGKDDKDERFVAVLEIPPVVSPETAVRVSIVSDLKKRDGLL